MRPGEARRMTAYGETHDAEEWADIIGVTPSTVRRHMGSPEVFRRWLEGRVGWSEGYILGQRPDTPVAALADDERIRRFVWGLAESMNDWDDLKAHLARDRAVLTVDGEVAQVLDWLLGRWRRYDGVWREFILADANCSPDQRPGRQ